MLEPEEVISEDDPISNGNSKVFCGQWYPNVVVHVVSPSVGAGVTITVELQASMNNQDFITIATDTYTDADDGVDQKLVKPAGEWWLNYRLKISTSGAETMITKALIGAGGA